MGQSTLALSEDFLREKVDFWIAHQCNITKCAKKYGVIGQKFQSWILKAQRDQIKPTGWPEEVDFPYSKCINHGNRVLVFDFKKGTVTRISRAALNKSSFSNDELQNIVDTWEQHGFLKSKTQKVCAMHNRKLQSALQEADRRGIAPTRWRELHPDQPFPFRKALQAVVPQRIHPEHGLISMPPQTRPKKRNKKRPKPALAKPIPPPQPVQESFEPAAQKPSIPEEKPAEKKSAPSQPPKHYSSPFPYITRDTFGAWCDDMRAAMTKHQDWKSVAYELDLKNDKEAQAMAFYLDTFQPGFYNELVEIRHAAPSSPEQDRVDQKIIQDVQEKLIEQSEARQAPRLSTPR